VRQTLSHGTRIVRVYAITTPGFQGASDLFKAVHAQCTAVAPVSSEQGPAMYWQTEVGAPAAALWDDATVYLVVSGTPTASSDQPDLRAVVAGLIDTVGRPCDAPMTGMACPPTHG
jgi:hypothetical protein